MCIDCIREEQDKNTSRQAEWIRGVVQNGAPTLRQEARILSTEEILSEEVRAVVRKMSDVLVSQEDGVAIAAPQIDQSLAIFLVAGKLFDPLFLSDEYKHKTDADYRKKYPDMICINPRITKASKDKKWLSEGCLSVRYQYGKVRRSNKVEIEYTDETGKKKTRGGSGLLAQIFQHEIDHLHGILFIDTAKDVKYHDPEKHIEP